MGSTPQGSLSRHVMSDGIPSRNTKRIWQPATEATKTKQTEKSPICQPWNSLRAANKVNTDTPSSPTHSSQRRSKSSLLLKINLPSTKAFQQKSTLKFSSTTPSVNLSRCNVRYDSSHVTTQCLLLLYYKELVLV